MDAVIKFRVNQWYNKKTRDFVYGVDSIHNSGRVCHVCDENGMLSYETKMAAEKAIGRLNKDIKEYGLEKGCP